MLSSIPAAPALVARGRLRALAFRPAARAALVGNRRPAQVARALAHCTRIQPAAQGWRVGRYTVTAQGCTCSRSNCCHLLTVRLLDPMPL